MLWHKPLDLHSPAGTTGPEVLAMPCCLYSNAFVQSDPFSGSTLLKKKMNKLKHEARNSLTLHVQLAALALP